MASTNKYGKLKNREEGGLTDALKNNMGQLRVGKTKASSSNVPSNTSSSELEEDQAPTSTLKSVLKVPAGIGMSTESRNITQSDSIRDRGEELIKAFNETEVDRFTSFSKNAKMMKECFKDLWMSAPFVISPLFVENSIALSVCEIEVPSYILWKKEYARCRVGTCNSIDEWRQGSPECKALVEWKAKNAKYLNIMDPKNSPNTCKAIVKIFCFEEVCKIGIKGIIRFLLMQNTRSYIFGTPLMKALISWKWEHIWRGYCYREVTQYVIFLVVFSIYATLVSCSSSALGSPSWYHFGLTMLLLILMVLSFKMKYSDYRQMRTYMVDGRKLFPNEHFFGIKYYFSSRWTTIRSTVHFIMITVLPLFHIFSIHGASSLRYFYACLAVEAILVWAQVLYFALASKKFGPLALMVKNVIDDCTPFFVLAAFVFIGFSLAQYVLFQYSLTYDVLDEEVKERIQLNFGSFIRTMVTMFGSMVGTFDIEVYFYAGSLWTLITLLFFLFLVAELLLMLNLLILLMSNTLDRVKNTEEEHLLKARAKFIDSFEASLIRNEIEEIESRTNKYLYTLEPVDNTLDNITDSWKGPIRTIEDSVSTMMSQLEANLIMKANKRVASLEEKWIKHKNEAHDFIRAAQENMNTRIKILQEKIQEESEMTKQVMGLLEDKHSPEASM